LRHLSLHFAKDYFIAQQPLLNSLEELINNKKGDQLRIELGKQKVLALTSMYQNQNHWEWSEAENGWSAWKRWYDVTNG
jgi:hypothetical protein